MDSFKEVWQLVREDMKSAVTETAYSVWLEPLEFIKYENKTVTLRINAAFKKDVILDKFATVIRDSVENVFGFKADIEIVVPGESTTALPDTEDSAVKKIQDKYKYTFENFIIGSSNKFAHAAALSVANNPGEGYNPLFIHGHSGLGKTHLLMAIQKRLLENNPTTNIIYTSGEIFTNELVHYISMRDTHTFHERYRNVDVLLIDDIQFIAKTDKAQEEFFHTFDYLVSQNKQVVLTSDRPPKEMPTLSERLRTRFESGLMADIQPPSVETRMAIIKVKAEERGMELSDDIIKCIAEHIKKNIRQLEGIVKKLEAKKVLSGIDPTIEVVNQVMEDIINDAPSEKITIDNIIQEVARQFAVPPSDIRSEKRNSNIVNARQVAMYIIHERTGLSLKAIGQEFGNKHHTTVLHSLEETEIKMQKNVSLRACVDDIMKNLDDL